MSSWLFLSMAIVGLGPLGPLGTEASTTPEPKSSASREYRDLGFRCIAPGSGWHFRADETPPASDSETNGLRLLGTAQWTQKKGKAEIGVASWVLSSSVDVEYLLRLVKRIEKNDSAPGRMVRGDWTEHHGYLCYVATHVRDGSRTTCIYMLAGRRLFLIVLEAANSTLQDCSADFQQLIDSFQPLVANLDVPP